MPTWVKVVLIVVLVGFVVLVAGIIVAARWVKQRGASLKEEGQAVMAEARAFGQGKDGEACIAEAFKRLETAPGFIGEAKVKMFLQTCLGAANVAPETCEGVPRMSEIMRSAQWSLDECARRGHANSQRCTRLIGAVQAHCEMARRQ